MKYPTIQYFKSNPVGSVKSVNYWIVFFNFWLAYPCIAQDSILNFKKENFTSSKIVNAQSTVTLKKKHLEFTVASRFSNMYDKANPNPINETGHTFLGLDHSSDLRISLDYGLTNKITVGFGRSKFKETYDGNIKYRFLTQDNSANRPVALCFYGNIGYSSLSTANLYIGTIKPQTKEIHRLRYCSQLLISKNFDDFFLQLMPTFIYRNFIKEQLNLNNQAEDKNGLFSLGMGSKIRINNHLNFVAECFFNFSKFQNNNPLGYYNPLSIGLEAIIKGYTYNIVFSNSAAILESNMLINTTDAWKNGQIKLGFNLAKKFVL